MAVAAGQGGSGGGGQPAAGLGAIGGPLEAGGGPGGRGGGGSGSGGGAVGSGAHASANGGSATGLAGGAQPQAVAVASNDPLGVGHVAGRTRSLRQAAVLHAPVMMLTEAWLAENEIGAKARGSCGIGGDGPAATGAGSCLQTARGLG